MGDMAAEGTVRMWKRDYVQYSVDLKYVGV